MTRRYIYLLTFLICGLYALNSSAKNSDLDHLIRLDAYNPPDTTLPYDFGDDDGNPYNDGFNHGLYLKDPNSLNTYYEYDPETNQYVIYKKIGDIYYRTPFYMSFDDFLEWDLEKSVQEYWKERASLDGLDKRSGLIPKISVGNEAFERIFGSNTIDIRPQGSAELIFGVNASKREDPLLDVKDQKTANFVFDEKIQMNVMAKIGDKIEFGTSYNTEASFDFENKMNLAYEGKEDEIIQLIEGGDVNLPLNGTLITGSQRLFGLKTKMQFGRATFTTVLSQQKSESSNITVSGGAQTSEFYFKADEYEENKHFFIAQYFRNNYDYALSNLPIIQSPINITKIEVWVTNIGPATQDNRNIVAFTDVGEFKPYRDQVFLATGIDSFPDNGTNDLFYNYVSVNQIRDIDNINTYLTSGQAGYQFTGGIDYEKVENARLLTSNEYTFNNKLGFISLNTRLNPDQVLAIAYQYTVIGQDSIYQVGEFANSGINSPNTLVAKLIKSTSQNTDVPLWDLMMKNVYSIGAYQVNNQDFRLNILYTEDENGIPIAYLSDGPIQGEPLIRVMGLDRLNFQLDPIPDGVFDFIDNAAITGGTINSRNGRIYFPVIEPFGSHLRKMINDDNIADRYVFEELYRTTKNEAQQNPDKNRFMLEGTYKSSSGAEISLNAFNVPQGSVKVTAGGVPLRENVDFIVDYTLGKVTIINEGYLNSGTPINISTESNALFSVQTKRLLGTHMDFKVNKDFNIGATILNLNERPLFEKVDFGDEPISNTIWGMDLNYTAESRFLTTLIDKIPLLATKTPSRITIAGEFAHFIPGHARAINTDDEKGGISYIDDFEGSSSGSDMKNLGQWHLASTPRGQTSSNMFPEAGFDSIVYGYNRAKFSWYIVDRLFLEERNITPQHIKNDKDMQSDHMVRQILETEVFPNKQSQNNIAVHIPVLNLAFYPSERGPYNFDVEGVPGVSKGINPDGTLADPRSRWGGIMRKIESTDFEAVNIEYIEFWMMDPFINDPNHSGGYLYFNLGDISEDVLKDSRKSYENGLPTSATVINVDTTIWGRVPTLQPLVNTFDNNPSSREFQDVGLDGLSDADEMSYYDQRYNYLQRLNNVLSPTAFQKFSDDPSGDNYHYYLGSDYDTEQRTILRRYKEYNGMDGNSPTPDQSNEPYPTQATPIPDIEDINNDNTLSEDERYFQYRIHLRPDKMEIGSNYISDVYTAQSVRLANNTNADVRWYQFKIPVRSPDKVVGQIRDYKSIRFMRTFMKDWQDSVVLRLATLELVRGEWRKYNKQLLDPGEYIPNDNQNETSFEISIINIEENGFRQPIPYVLPPGIQREEDIGLGSIIQRNEQSLIMKTCNLNDGDARAGYKTTDLDLRRYRRLKMFVHAEETDPVNFVTNDGDLTVFIRLGADFTNNYYEYEIPLTFTPWNVSALDDEAIWPFNNHFDVELAKLVSAKQERNIAMRNGSPILLTDPFIKYDGLNKVTVVGTPSLSDVKTIMIGIRNPKKQNINDPDDGLPKCAEIWVNELRLADFDEKSGWAANARINADLADIGNVILAGSMSTPGFGSLEKAVNERQLEQVMQYDVATNLELGKFFPEKTGMRIPMHFDVSETFINPEFNPLNPDVEFKEDLLTYPDLEERDSIRAISQGYVKRKNINFTNIKKNKTGNIGKSKIYDVENFDLTYAYSEFYERNVDIEYHVKKNHLGALGYNFSTSPKNVRPFGKSKFLKKYKILALIKDFNFYYSPKMLSFRTNITRQYDESLLRNKSRGIVPREPYFAKQFNWNRNYDLQYDLSQSLRLDYHAIAAARVREPDGIIDKTDKESYKAYRAEVIDELLHFGDMNNFNQQFGAIYNVPLNKIPLLDWISSSVKYTNTFIWTRAPISLPEVGNTIENTRTINLNGNANINNLYNKVGYFKKLNTKSRGGPQRGTAPGRQTQVPLELEAENDSIEEKTNYAKLILDNTLRVIMSVKTASFTYNQSDGTYLPGFNGTPQAIGNDWTTNSPGLDFIFGGQPDDFLQRVYSNNWMTTSDSLVTTPYANKSMKDLTYRASVEPWPFMRLELTGFRKQSESIQGYLRSDNSPEGYAVYSPTSVGTFSMSMITWKTLFDVEGEDNISANFSTFMDARFDIADRLAQENPSWDGTYNDTTGFPNGYGPTSSQVMIPAFISAYTGKSSQTVELSPFPKIPLPNWRLTISGLNKIDFIKSIFKNVSIGHAYRSSYNVGNYASDIRYREGDDIRDLLQNYVAPYEINQISITEQLSPLLNIDMQWNNSLLTRIEYKRSRNLSMSFANNQLTEVTTKDFIIGLGYRIKDVEFDVKAGGTMQHLKSDLDLKADISIRNNKTVLRKIVEESNQISAGQQVIVISFTADYMISNNFNARLFFDRNVTNPFISQTYPTANTNAGISLRFSLAQ